MNGRVGQFNEWPRRAADELTAIGRVQDAVIRRHLGWLKKRKRAFDCTAWEMCGCTTVQFVAHFEKLFSREMHWKNFGAWSIDHIYPLSAVNSEKEEEIFAAFHFTNLRPLWLPENLKKGRRVESVVAPRSSLRRYRSSEIFTEIPLSGVVLRNERANK
jgi:hypothetical protein